MAETLLCLFLNPRTLPGGSMLWGILPSWGKKNRQDSVTRTATGEKKKRWEVYLKKNKYPVAAQ